MLRSAHHTLVRLGASSAALALLLAACAAPEAAPSVGQTTQATAAAASPAAAASAAATTATSPTTANVILAKIPNAPTAAPAAPPPSGATPAPAPTPPAARVVPLYAHVDTVTAGPGESKYRVDASLACTKSGVFSRGQHIVWRMELVDTSSGKVLQGPDVRTAMLKLPTGDEVKFGYGRHGATEDSPWFFTAAWDVPLTFPLGTLDYQISVLTTAGKELVLGDPLTMKIPAGANPRFPKGLDTRVLIVD